MIHKTHISTPSGRGDLRVLHCFLSMFSIDVIPDYLLVCRHSRHKTFCVSFLSHQNEPPSVFSKWSYCKTRPGIFFSSRNSIRSLSGSLSSCKNHMSSLSRTDLVSNIGPVTGFSFYHSTRLLPNIYPELTVRFPKSKTKRPSPFRSSDKNVPSLYSF